METSSQPPPPPYRLQTLGTLALNGWQQATIAADRRQQRRRLALLAVLASAGERGRSRDQLLLLFWPDSTEKNARHSLDQLLYAMRTSIHNSVFTGVNPIRLNPSVVDADVRQFESNIDSGNLDAAVAAYHGPFLDGFHPGETREFEEWLDTERQRLATRYLDALTKLAASAERGGDFASAIRWRRKVVEIEPLSTRHAIDLVRTLANSGDFATALDFAARYERTAQRELGVDNIPELKNLVAEIRSRPPSNSQSVAIYSKPIEPEDRQSSSSSAKADTPRAKTEMSERSVRRFPPAALFATGLSAVVLLIGFSYTRRSSDGRPTIIHPTIASASVVSHNVGRAARGTRNIVAYDLYLRAQDPVRLRNDSAAAIGMQYLEKAVALDPGFAAAHAAAAEMYVRLAFFHDPPLPQSELRRRGEAAARKAVALDDSLAEAHRALGMIQSFWRTDLQSAESELNKALELDPHLPHAREYLAMVHTYMGKPREALADAQRAVAEDPLSPVNQAVLAQMLYVNGRCKEALPILDSLALMKPPLLRVAGARAICYADERRWSEVAAISREPAGRGDTGASAMLGFSLARTGRRDEALEIRNKLRAIASRDSAAHFDAAIVSFALGDIDDAIRNIEAARNTAPFPYELMGPVFASLRADTRFRKLSMSSPY